MMQIITTLLFIQRLLNLIEEMKKVLLLLLLFKDIYLFQYLNNTKY